MMMDTEPAVLVISASDSSGGAGMQRDLRVLANFGVRAVAALTAVTAQTDGALTSMLVLPASLLREQINAALDTCCVGAIKIGMLGNVATAHVIADAMEKLSGVPIILDPVLSTSSGAVLLDEEGRRVMHKRLFPLVTLLTPNMPEASHLLENGDEPVQGEGPHAILLKGGHGQGDQAIDLLLETGRDPIALAAPRIDGTMRGTGCGLSTAIAAGLAKGRSLEDSCRNAKEYVWTQMRVG